MRELVPLLEASLYSKQAVLAMAAATPGATAASIMAELIRQTQVLRGANGGMSAASSSSVTGPSISQGHVADAYEEALTGEAFIKFKTAMADADLLSTSGRRAAFEAATAGDCVLPIRLLLTGENTLAKRDAALGALMGLRPFLSEWFTYVAVIDASGAVHPGLTKWCITGQSGKQTAFLDSFLKLEFHNMNWMGSYETPGLLHFLSAKHHAPIAAPHPSDHYCVPMDLRALASFGQSLFSGIGYPALPGAPAQGGNAGYSWATWWNYLAEVVERAATLPSREAQLDWLDDVHEQAEAALLLMSRLAKAEIYASEGLRDHELGALLPHDCAPAEYLRTKIREFDEDQAREARMRPFLGGRGRQPTLRASAHDLPVRSVRHKKRKPELQLGKGGKGGDAGDIEEVAPPSIEDNTLSGGEEKTKESRARGATLKKPFWLKPKEYLLVSGRVWNVKKLAAKLGIGADSKCWEVILSRRTDAHRQEGCPMRGVGAAHSSLTASAHAIEGFEAAAYFRDFSRAPTEGELKRASASGGPRTPPAGRGSREADRGRRGRGQGFPKPASA